MRNIDVFEKEMEDIGSDPDSEHVFHVSDFEDLRNIESALVRRTCREAPPGEWGEKCFRCSKGLMQLNVAPPGFVIYLALSN